MSGFVDRERMIWGQGRRPAAAPFESAGSRSPAGILEVAPLAEAALWLPWGRRPGP
jgi:hypothetical protein